MSARVLVVDDSSTIRKVVGGVLTRAGYGVAFANDGVQAFDSLKRDHFDLALVDFVMPRLNGFDLCKRLRDDADLRTLPVVLMSAKTDRIRDHFLRQTGAIDAITKPFDPRALLLAVEAGLRKRDRTSVGRQSAAPPASLSPSFSASGESRAIDGKSGSFHARMPAPDGFVRRLSQAYARVGELGPEAIVDAASVESALRRALGDEGLSALYAELAGPTASAALSGAVEAIPLAEVLQLLQLQQQTGLLTVTDGRAEVRIAMRDGFVDLATSRGAADEFRLGRYLVEAGIVSRERLDAAVAAERATKRPRLLGDALVAEQILTRDQLHQALARQTSELIYDVLRWTRGRFVFEQRATRIESMATQLGLPLASIVMEGYRRVDEWRQMEEVLGDFDVVPYRDEMAIDALAAHSAEAALGKLSREERVVLEAVDGKRSVREIVAAVSMGSFDVCRILFQLIGARLVRRRVG
ncbi:MAG: DUF4388 domain-containing protein [Polyangiales bacterium]